MLRRLPIFICLVFLCVAAQAQLPANAVNRFTRAMNFQAQHDMAGAYASMEEAISLYPAFAEAYSQLGQWYYQAHRFDKAVDVFNSPFLYLSGILTPGPLGSAAII